MEIGDYARHIRTKFRLSLAVAITKSRPENLTIDSYISELRSKINKTITDDDNISICSDDFSMDIEIDSPNLLEEYNDIFNDDLEVGTCGESSVVKPQLSPIQCQNNEISEHIDLNDIQLINSEYNITNAMKNIDENLFKSINDKVIENQNLKCNNTNENADHIDFDAIKDVNSCIRDEMKLTDENIDIIDLTADNNEDNLNLNSNNVIVIQNDIRYDKFNRIIDENLNLNRTNDVFTQEYTHISQSQTECLKISENLLRKRHFDTNNDVQKKIVRIEFDTNIKPISENVKKITQDNINEFKNQKNEENWNFVENNTEILHLSQELIIKTTTDSKNDEFKNQINEEYSKYNQNTEILHSSQELINKTTTNSKNHEFNNQMNEENLNFNKNNTESLHLSQELINKTTTNSKNHEFNNQINEENLNFNKNNTELLHSSQELINKTTTNSKNHEFNNQINEENLNFNKNNTELLHSSQELINKTTTNSKNHEFNNQMNEENLNFNENNTELLHSSQELIIKTTTDSKTQENYPLASEDNTNFSQYNSTENFSSQSLTTDYNKYDSLFEENIDNFVESNTEKEEQVKNALNHIDKMIEEIKLQKENELKRKDMITQTGEANDFVNENEINFSDTDDDENELHDIVGSYTESVPAKVMMEVNKLKTYLNKSSEKGYASSLDSGFMSDSQKLSSTQSTPTLINEPAHCVLQFLMEATLNMYTHDIINDISKTLGQLVDRLHTIELYPSFLETMLRNIEQLIENIYMEKSMDNVMEEEIEMKIQKLLLLNRSIHIIKITLEQITNKLENTYTNLSSNSEPYEIKNLTTLENLPHILNLLEILIKRFSISNTASQNAEVGNTQEKKTQKSQISDFWKRKWDPNYEKNCSKIKIFDGKNIMLKLSEILNKYVVHCMDDYGLLAFAALQCFNVLQSK